MNQARRHLERLRRSFARIQEHGASAQAYDDLMHFFEDCWHLKDHIKSCLIPAQEQQLEREIDQPRHLDHLKIVADLANKSKHVTLSKKNRVDATVTHKRIHASDGSCPPPATAEYTVTLRDGSTEDAHFVAQQAMAEWEGVLKSYGL